MHALYRWLWTQGPGNPMVMRIVQGGGRRTYHLWVRMGYLGALILLVLTGLMTGGGMGAQASMTDLAQAGTWIFAFIAYGQVVLVCLLAPLFMAAAIRQEQAGQTLDILLTTPLSNVQIVLGTLLGRLFFVLALLLSGLPLFAVLLVFGGVPIASVFVAFAVAGLTALTVGAVAVALAVFRVGGRRAVFTFVVIVTAYLIGAYALDVGLLRRITAIPDSTTWLTPLHPLLVLEASLSPAQYRPPGEEYLAERGALARLYLGRPLATFALLSVGISALLTAASALALRQVGSADAGHGLTRRLKRMVGLAVPEAGGERRKEPRDVGANPIAWREANTRGRLLGTILARWSLAGLAIGAAVLLLILYHAGGLPTVPGAAAGQTLAPHEVLHAGLLILLLMEIGVVSLVAIYMSAGAVSREREDGTLDLVLTTPITPKQYIWGKLRGLVSFLSLLIAVPVVTLALAAGYALVAGWAGVEHARFLHTATTRGGGQVSADAPLILPEAPLLLVVMLVPFVGLCVMAGMSWSLKARGVLGAVVPTVAAIGVLALLLGVCGLSAAEQVPLIGPMLNAFSPATNIVMIVNPWDHVANFAVSPGLGRVSLAVAAAVAAGGYSAVVYAMLLGMVRSFDQTVRRLSGTG
ncbi:MAG: hypothetical protein WD009_05395 [Phycisphaeraceae bacterium]